MYSNDEEGRFLLAKHLAVKTGGLLGTRFHQPVKELHVKTKKSDGNTPVTSIDMEIRELVWADIERFFPSDSIITEESKHCKHGSSPYTWWVDEADGTSNVLSHLPLSVSGIAVSRNGQTIFGAVGNPFENTLTYSREGRLTYVRPLTPNHQGVLKSVRVVTGRPRHERFAIIDANFNPRTAERKTAFLRELSKYVQNIRMVGSNILAWTLVAQGRVEIAFMDCVGGHWDTAPGLPMVPNARKRITDNGGKITDKDGGVPTPGAYHVVLATNGELHDPVLRLVQKHYSDYAGFR